MPPLTGTNLRGSGIVPCFTVERVDMADGFSNGGDRTYLDGTVNSEQYF